MSVNVTVVTSSSSSVIVPFTSAANAAAAQAALDQNGGLNQLGAANFIDYFSPPDVSGPVALPVPSGLFGGVTVTVPALLNLGIMDPSYMMLINNGGTAGLIAAIGGASTTVVSAAGSNLIYDNQSPRGRAFIGGGENALSNAFSTSRLDATVDSDSTAALGHSTFLILDDHVGGTMNVSVGGSALVSLIGGGADSVIAQSGTVAVLSGPAASLSGTATVGTSGAGASAWVSAEGGKVFITPGAGDAFVFQGSTITEHSATLFGGTKLIGGSLRTAAAFTGQATVLSMNGYLESGSKGGSILQSGTTAGAATLVAGGSGDTLLIRAVGDSANLGDGTGVQANASTITSGGGDIFTMGAGSGTAVGALDGHNTFNFSNAGHYSVIGGHDTTPGANFLKGSTYVDNSTSTGGTGSITILDFLPQQVPSASTPTFDQVDLKNKTVLSLTNTVAGGGLFNNTAVLSDGTTINFNNASGIVHQVGTFLQ
jgi:hypothetical protein